MTRSNQYLIAAVCTAGLLSCLYFLSLQVHMPFLVTILLALIAVVAVFRFVCRNAADDAASATPAMEWLSIAAIVVTLAFLGININVIAQKYGGWDATGTWNLHAAYLADAANWKKMFQNTDYAHPDYPLCLPAIIAFFTRLFAPGHLFMVPFVVAATCTLIIPVLIFGAVAKKSITLGMAAMAVFVLEHYYVACSVNQYADVVVALFLLCAFLCAAHMRHDTRYLALAAFFAACCAWTKNEGVILAFLFMAWHADVFFSRAHWLRTVAGLALPLTTLIIFKIVCHTTNDLVHEAHAARIIGFLGQAGRYKAVADSYIGMVSKEFVFTSMAIVAFALFCGVKRKFPGKPLLIVASCLVVYSMIYVVTPKDLAWHLSTSHSRLVLQLMPALVYVMSDHLANLAVATENGQRQNSRNFEA